MHNLSASNVTGDIIYVHILGNPIIVINSARVAEDLLDRRSSNYSSRYIHFAVYLLPLNHGNRRPVRTMVVEL
jgi:hypothetical protein